MSPSKSSESWIDRAYLGEDAKDEKEEQKRLEERFKPLLEWLKDEAKDIVRDGAFPYPACE